MCSERAYNATLLRVLLIKTDDCKKKIKQTVNLFSPQEATAATKTYYYMYMLQICCTARGSKSPTHLAWFF